jgi:hypothetical protein
MHSSLISCFNIIVWRLSLVFVKATENETLEGIGQLCKSSKNLSSISLKLY